MKKVMMSIFLVALVVFIIAWGFVGMKLVDGDYDITAGAYVAFGCVLIMFGCNLYRIFNTKCPHCGKLRLTNGEYCPYCGKKIK